MKEENARVWLAQWHAMILDEGVRNICSAIVTSSFPVIDITTSTVNINQDLSIISE